MKKTPLRPTADFTVAGINPIANFNAALDAPNFYSICIEDNRVAFKEATVRVFLTADDVRTTGVPGAVVKPEYTELAAVSLDTWEQAKAAITAAIAADAGGKKARTAFRSGDNALERMIGRSVLLLAYALDYAEKHMPDAVPQIVFNWVNLPDAYRWALFAFADATASNAAEGKGWRAGIAIGLAGKY